MVDRWNGAPYVDEGPHPDGPMVYYADYEDATQASGGTAK
jgi:hypothetical protein